MYSNVCGLDEAGRGALAGPMVLTAVTFPLDFTFEKVAPQVIVRDSKQLSLKQRMAVYELIQKYSVSIDTEIMTVKTINKNGVQWANKEGFRRLILRNEASTYVVDGRWRLHGLGSKTMLTNCIIDADEKIPCALAAGIVAKVKRDEIMLSLHRKFTKYGWNTNTGHGTRKHIEALKNYGSCHYHRTRFVETALENYKKYEQNS